MSESNIVPIASPGPEVKRAALDAELITLEEVRRLRGTGGPVVVLDVRTARTYNDSDMTAEGAVRVDPDRAVQEARRLGLPRDAWLPSYCT